MTTQAVFVDLPNIYGSLIRSGLGETKVLREYFLTWLDLDLLATNLTGALPSIWVFYSSGRIGPSEARVDGQVLKNYVNRITSLDGVTARDVNIPGDQRETLTVKCDKCGQETRLFLTIRFRIKKTCKSADVRTSQSIFRHQSPRKRGYFLHDFELSERAYNRMEI